LEDRRNVGESSCNSGDGTDQRVQSLMFMMMMIVSMMHGSTNIKPLTCLSIGLIRISEDTPVTGLQFLWHHKVSPAKCRNNSRSENDTSKTEGYSNRNIFQLLNYFF